MRSRDGGFVNKSVDDTPTDSSATGVWFLDESRQWAAASKWPIRSISFLSTPSSFDWSANASWSLTLYFYSGYEDIEYQWESQNSIGQPWYASPATAMSGASSGQKSATYRSGDYYEDGFNPFSGFLRLSIDTGLKIFKSPSIELVSYSITSFVWTQQPVDTSPQYGQLFYFWAAAEATSSIGTVYYLHNMACQWEISTNAGSTWQDMPNETSSTLWLVAGVNSNSQSGCKYRLRVNLPDGTVHRSDAATLTV